MKTANEAELKTMGREVASAMIKGRNEGVPKPTSAVPIPTLMYVADMHQVEAISPADYTTLAKAMEEALEEAERWNETTEVR